MVMSKIFGREYGCLPIILTMSIWTLVLNIIKYASFGFNELFTQTGIFMFSYTLVLPTVMYFIVFIITTFLSIFRPKNQDSLYETNVALLPYIAGFSFLLGLLAETIAYVFFDLDLLEFFYDWIDWPSRGQYDPHIPLPTWRSLLWGKKWYLNLTWEWGRLGMVWRLCPDCWRGESIQCHGNNRKIKKDSKGETVLWD